MTVILGGTFSVLHKGHRAMLSEAASTGEPVIIGLTTDEFLGARKGYSTPPYPLREKNLSTFLRTISSNFTILPLNSDLGNAFSSQQYDSIVVSPETYPNALKINEKRISGNMAPLAIRLVPHVLADDLFPISSSRILSGEIDAEGKRMSPLRVSVSTGNDLKERAVHEFFSRRGVDVLVRRNREYDLATNQPLQEDTLELAKLRASSVTGGYDYSIGIESGIFKINREPYDFHACAVLDRFGAVSSGFSSGFRIPDSIIDLTKRGMDISQAFTSLHGEADIGSKGGIAGILSRNSLNRYDLIMESVRNAFIPRIRPDLYLAKK
ncbi:MAG: pantetheine-phosphate adenylyltransferase [Candidatus Thermoplasmatota archaeon]|nr:pantetheine-phosphate adenylyltransferase [Candidatus Thermoplasmatota archaeon]MCL5437818.1 pantetheine-phosphate adenylyltransferase [Candidatus Thermoplasmatota archaeon]